jgi:hypothetical protein
MISEAATAARCLVKCEAGQRAGLHGRLTAASLGGQHRGAGRRFWRKYLELGSEADLVFQGLLFLIAFAGLSHMLYLEFWIQCWPTAYHVGKSEGR